MSLGTFWYKKYNELKEQNKQLREKVEGYERTRDRLIEMGFPTFKSCREYAEQIEKLQEDLKHKKIGIQNRKTRIKDLEAQIEELKKENGIMAQRLHSRAVMCNEQCYDKIYAEEQLEQAKKLLAKWVELFKPKCDTFLPTPIQVDTEQFLNEVTE